MTRKKRRAVDRLQRRVWELELEIMSRDMEELLARDEAKRRAECGRPGVV